MHIYIYIYIYMLCANVENADWYVVRKCILLVYMYCLYFHNNMNNGGINVYFMETCSSLIAIGLPSRHNYVESTLNPRHGLTLFPRWYLVLFENWINVWFSTLIPRHFFHFDSTCFPRWIHVFSTLNQRDVFHVESTSGPHMVSTLIFGSIWKLIPCPVFNVEST